MHKLTDACPSVHALRYRGWSRCGDDRTLRCGDNRTLRCGDNRTLRCGDNRTLRCGDNRAFESLKGSSCESPRQRPGKGPVVCPALKGRNLRAPVNGFPRHRVPPLQGGNALGRWPGVSLQRSPCVSLGRGPYPGGSEHQMALRSGDGKVTVPLVVAHVQRRNKMLPCNI